VTTITTTMLMITMAAVMTGKTLRLVYPGHMHPLDLSRIPISKADSDGSTTF